MRLFHIVTKTPSSQAPQPTIQTTNQRPQRTKPPPPRYSRCTTYALCKYRVSTRKGFFAFCVSVYGFHALCLCLLCRVCYSHLLFFSHKSNESEREVSMMKHVFNVVQKETVYLQKWRRRLHGAPCDLHASCARCTDRTLSDPTNMYTLTHTNTNKLANWLCASTTAAELYSSWPRSMRGGLEVGYRVSIITVQRRCVCPCAVLCCVCVSGPYTNAFVGIHIASQSASSSARADQRRDHDRMPRSLALRFRWVEARARRLRRNGVWRDVYIQ